MSFKFRPHRGALADSMKEVKRFDSIEALISHLSKGLPTLIVNKETVKIEPYCFDKRINWDTYIVTLKDYGVLGFTDGKGE